MILTFSLKNPTKNLFTIKSFCGSFYCLILRHHLSLRGGQNFLENSVPSSEKWNKWHVLCHNKTHFKTIKNLHNNGVHLYYFTAKYMFARVCKNLCFEFIHLILFKFFCFFCFSENTFSLQARAELHCAVLNWKGWILPSE